VREVARAIARRDGRVVDVILRERLLLERVDVLETYNTGNYEYSNGSITMTNASSSSTPSCMGMAEVLAVTWTNQCKTVMFTKTSDACAGRTADLSGDTLAYAILDMSL
jgi:hypothetical protein